MNINDIKIIPEPIDEDSIIDIMNGLNIGSIRRFGAVLNHIKAGFEYNSMLVWQISEDDIDKAGELIAKHKSVSHCYRRHTETNWPYNLYAMLHSKDMDTHKISIADLCKTLDENVQVIDFQELPTIEELKKTSFMPETFSDL